MGGCETGSGTFPYLGCQLKYQASVSDSCAAWLILIPSLQESDRLQCLGVVSADGRL